MSRRVAVELTWEEIRIGGIIAIARQTNGQKEEWKDRYGLKDYDLGGDYNWRGVLGEIAAAKYLDAYWPGLGLTLDSIDAGVAQVRAVGKDHHRLLLHPPDKAHLPWVQALVKRQRLPLVCLTGWIMGADGKHPDHWGDPGDDWGKPTGRKCFLVPDTKLLDMPDLQALVGRKAAA